MQRILTPAVVLLFGFALHAQTTIYNSIPTPFPPAMTSQSFQAGRISEFGNRVNFDFGGNNRNLISVRVAMATLGYFSKYYDPATTQNTGGWTHDITLTLYDVDNSGLNPEPGTPIGSVKQSFFIPWRPEPSPACGVGSTMWLAPDGCHNSLAFNITFDFPLTNLPDQLIFGIAYNTESAGLNPIGVNGPWNDLNVGLNAAPFTVGQNLSAPTAYLNGTINGSYADNGAGGVGVFRLDVDGTHTTIAIEFNPPPAFITVAGGGTQSAAVGTQFGTALQARVTEANEGGKALAGVAVTFSLPVSGASATLSTTSVITDSSGIATVTATANATPRCVFGYSRYSDRGGCDSLCPIQFDQSRRTSQLHRFCPAAFQHRRRQSHHSRRHRPVDRR
jgi:hypothetical protein